MIAQDKDRIECAIRHIQTAVDIDPWAVEIAVEAMKAQLSAEGTTSDLISRQDAIEVIEEMQMPIMRSMFPEEQFVFKGMSEALSAIKDLPSAQPEPQWIPVSEKLLGENEFVLVTFGWFGRKTDPGVNIDEIRDGDWMISEVVTAWMLLPEPYRAERRTDEDR